MKMAELHADVADIETEKEFQMRLKLESILQLLEDARIDMRHIPSDDALRNWSDDSQAQLAKAIDALKPLAGY